VTFVTLVVLQMSLLCEILWDFLVGWDAISTRSANPRIMLCG